MTDEQDPFDEENWTCPDCGSEDPHAAIYTPETDEFEDEVEIDVTCKSVYILPVDGGPGFAFDYDEFERIVDHFKRNR